MAVSAGRARPRRSFQLPAFRVNRMEMSSAAFLPAIKHRAGRSPPCPRSRPRSPTSAHALSSASGKRLPPGRSAGLRLNWTSPSGSSLVVALVSENRKKKADVAEHPRVFDHVGLLFNEPVATATCPSLSHPTASKPIGAAQIPQGCERSPDAYFKYTSPRPGMQADCGLPPEDRSCASRSRSRTIGWSAS